jgi:4-amino-4-deoxy-L-arabinose transferase-like glycosyltransferase
MRSFSRRREVWSLLLIWGVATALNVTKAYHIDDTAYLEVARAILAYPLRPMSGQVNWGSFSEPIHQINQPPLLSYMLAGVFYCCGESEFAPHLLISLFTLAATAFFYQLARRFAPRHALLTTALFVLGPSFIPSQNVMCDIPMVALWLLFFCAILCPGGEDETSRRYALASAAAAAACLMKYTSLVLLPVLCASVALRKGRRPWWSVGIPVAALAAWSVFNYLDYGGIHLLGRAGQAGLPRAEVLWHWVIFLGAMSPFSLLYVPRLMSSRRGQVLLALLAAPLVVEVVKFCLRPDAPPTSLLRTVFIVNGLLVSGSTLHLLARRFRPNDAAHGGRDEVVILTLWLLGSFAFVVLLSPSMAARHLLPVIPAILLILGGQMPEVPARWRHAGLAATVILGVALGVSDWVFADAYRRQAPMIATLIKKQLPARANVWFVGHWGWQWYAAKEGMKQFDSMATHFQPDDLLVKPALVSGQEIRPDEAQRLHPVATIKIVARPQTVFRTMTMSPWGGFYFGLGESLPWTISREPLETFTIYRYQ